MKKLIPLFAALFCLIPIIPAWGDSGEVGKTSSEAAEKTHWLTNSSKIRHNKSCRYFKKSKGRLCSPTEGKSCKKCGG
jgi:hypothetical protein